MRIALSMLLVAGLAGLAGCGGGGSGGGSGGSTTPVPTSTSCAQITSFSNSTGYYSVFAIQGTAHDNVWALSGANGSTVVHHDGIAWSVSAPPAGG